MDIMLYIIAGLVIIAVIAVVVMRKNKGAQTPPQQQERPSTPARSSTPSTAPPEHAAPTPAETVKFDNLTVAQRFMDQQRYDKAIETLERGLAEKPNNAPLLLKLLNVYVLTEQTDKFYSTYEKLETHGDTQTLAQAQELKALIDGEQSQTFETTSTASAAENNEPDFEMDSLDFDLGDKQDVSEPASPETEPALDVAPSNQQPVTTDTDSQDITRLDDDAFDLLLDNLETPNIDTDKTDDEPQASDIVDDSNAFDSSSIVETETHDDDIFAELSSATAPVESDPEIEDSKAVDSQSEPTVDNIDDDFVLDFDLAADDTDSADSLSVDSEEDSALDNSELEDSSARQDILSSDWSTDEPTGDDHLEDITLDATMSEDSTVDDDDDFVLDFDELVKETEDSTQLDISGEADLQSEGEDFTLFAADEGNTLEDITFDTDTSDEPLSLDAPVILEETPESDETATLTPTDINLVHDEEVMDVQTPAPVEDSEPAGDNVPVVSTAELDFAKTLDGNQVTLDLASQYLKLGEYDSAKRLLDEVIAHGDAEQQAEAKALLLRTA